MAVDTSRIFFILSLAVTSSLAGWTNPIKMDFPINPSALNPTFSNNGSIMIFESSRPGGLGERDLWYSTKIDETWQTPLNLGPNVNTSSYDRCPYLTENGSKLYFASVNNLYSDIYVSQINGTVAGPKKNLGYPINSPYGESYPVLTQDGNTMFFASDKPGGYGSSDIWVSMRVGGNWSVPVNLGPVVNTPDIDSPCWISNNGSVLLISSNRIGSLGFMDIWYTVKKNGVWGIPVNMGAPINTAGFEFSATFQDYEGQMSGTLYLTRLIISEDVILTSKFTGVSLSVFNVSPASLGAIKSMYH